MDKYQKFRRHIRFCFSASIGGIFYVIRSDDVLCPCKPMTVFCQYPLYAVPDKHTAENRTSNTKISFLTVRRRQKIKDA